MVDPEEARMTLEVYLLNAVGQGKRIEQKGHDYAILVDRISHDLKFHFLLTWLTAGLWLIVFLVLWSRDGRETRILAKVDEQGQIRSNTLPKR